MEYLFLALLEIFGEPLLEMLSDFAAGALADLTQGWPIEPALSGGILLLAGAEAGLLSALAVPYRFIVTHVGFSGISLLLAPFAAGAATYFAGNLLRRFRWRWSNLVSVGGGCLFAFSMALVRWWLVCIQPW
jgi:hypothetical protein